MYLYGLYHTSGQLCYVGKTNDPENRLYLHWVGRHHNPNTKRWSSDKNKWLRTLREPPVMRILAVIEDDEADLTEFLAIARAMMTFGRDTILNGIPGKPYMKRNGRPRYRHVANSYIRERIINLE